MPASWYSAIVSGGTLRAAVAAGARSTRRGTNARARCNSGRSSSGRSLSSPKKRETSPAVIAGVRRLPRRVGAEADQQFAEVLALQQADKGVRRVVEALDDIFAVFELTAFDERRRDRAELAVALPLVADDKALDAEPLAHRRHQVRAGPRRRVVVLGDHAAHDHAAEIVQPREDGVLHGAADILEINIDPFRA